MAAVRKLRGPSLRDIMKTISKAPDRVVAEVTPQIAVRLTRMVQEAYDTTRTVYGRSRPAGVDGGPLDLVASGDTRRDLEFTVDGRRIRCTLGPNYTKYLVGKYKILPVGGSQIPASWVAAIREIVDTAMHRPEVLAA